MKMYRATTSWSIAVSWPLQIVIAIFAPLIMGVFGHGYSVATTALTILALAMMVNTGSGSNAIALLMAGRSRANLAIAGAAVVLNVGLNLLLIPSLTATGAAVAWTVSVVVTAVATSWCLYRVTRMRLINGDSIRLAAAALATYGGVGLVLREVWQGQRATDVWCSTSSLARASVRRDRGEAHESPSGARRSYGLLRERREVDQSSTSSRRRGEGSERDGPQVHMSCPMRADKSSLCGRKCSARRARRPSRRPRPVRSRSAMFHGRVGTAGAPHRSGRRA